MCRKINSGGRQAEGHKSMNSRPPLTTQMHILVTNFYNWFLLLCVVGLCMRKLGDIFQDKSGQCGGNRKIQNWFSYTQSTSADLTGFVSLHEEEKEGGTQCWYFCLSWVRASLAKLTVYYAVYCSTVQLSGLSSLLSLTESLTHWGGLHWPPLTLTLRKQHGAIWGETPANFQIKSNSCWWSKYLHFHDRDSLHQTAATPCQISLKSQCSLDRK